MATISGGELVVRTLLGANVRHVFGLHGAHLETIFQSLAKHGVPIIDTRHEVAAGHAAEGYARATRGLGVAMVTAGPGFTNVITSMANAFLDRTPVLYLSGSAALRDAESNTLQAGIDQVAIARPITKWAHQVTTAAQIPRLLAQAIRLATSAPTGPVLIDLPSDVLTTVVDEMNTRIPENILLDSPASPSGAAIEQTLSLLTAAKRPIVMVGPGAWQSDAGDELLKFVELTGIPVYSDFQSHGLLPSTHPLYGGTYHKLADLSGSDGRPDVVLALGVRFGLFTMGVSDRLLPSAVKLVHVDVDAKEIGRLRDAAVPIVADSRETLRALNAQAPSRGWPDRSAWQKIIQNAKAARRKKFSEWLTRSAPPIHPYQAVTAIADNLPEDTIVVGDGAESYHWLNEVIRQTSAGSYITHGFLGAVGFGMGLSLGAQVAHPQRRVLCLVGDGAVGFTIAEFDTMVRHGLPIVVVIMNNRSWAASQHFQEIVSGPDHVLGTKLGDARYHDVAKAFGANGSHITRYEELGPAIKAAFASGKPACINVEIDLAPIPPEIELLMARHN
ncbi:MAG TPA: thiamine pyrophosphate-binding protein [Steroidobacteraceae bacterium]|nr:thiamine pyrophosphate-binding protein [Steroidobacteraceae bacterium]